jgi:hypothetical protein
MRHPDTVYRGRRWTVGSKLGIGVTVLADNEPLTLRPVLRLSGFEWGYGGTGPRCLALALILDATGDRGTAIDAHIWFMWAKVACWGPEWSITAGEVRRWVHQWQRERDPQLTDDEPDVLVSPDGVPMGCGPVRRCRVCACTDADCRQCIRATGEPCVWVGDDEDLCSRCADEDHLAVGRETEGGAA